MVGPSVSERGWQQGWACWRWGWGGRWWWGRSASSPAKYEHSSLVVSKISSPTSKVKMFRCLYSKQPGHLKGSSVLPTDGGILTCIHPRSERHWKWKHENLPKCPFCRSMLLQAAEVFWVICKFCNRVKTPAGLCCKWNTFNCYSFQKKNCITLLSAPQGI